MYYLTFISEGAERQRYVDLCREAAYFALSWYYLWDVPFAQGQMLGDVGFRSRGWGNVSVENNMSMSSSSNSPRCSISWPTRAASPVSPA